MKKIILFLNVLVVIMACLSCDLGNSTSSITKTTDQTETTKTTKTTNTTKSSITTSSTTVKKEYTYIKSPKDTYEWPTTRSNPLINFDLPDPCIFRDDDGYFYVFSTEGTNDWEGEGIPIMSYIPIIKSKDLVNWEYVGPVFGYQQKPSWTNPKTQLNGNPGLWAPDVIKYKGLYYCYYTLGVYRGDITGSGIGVATATSVTGPYTDHGKIIDGFDFPMHGSLIDQCIVEQNGKLYMFFGSYGGIYYVPLSDDGLSLREGERPVAIAGVTSEYSGDYEAIYIRYMNGYYYMMGSHGSCCAGVSSTYRVVVFRSESLFGPYYYHKSDSEPEAPALGDKNGGNLVITGIINNQKVGEVSGPGHNALFQDDAGEWWILYHGFGRFDGASSGRSLYYDKLLWDENGYPYVSDYVSSCGKETEAPTLVSRTLVEK